MMGYYCTQVIQYAKDESIAVKKAVDGWKSNKRLKAENKQPNKQARTEAPAQQPGPTQAAPQVTARPQVCLW